LRRPTIDALLCLLHLRPPETTLTAAEGELLARLAAGRRSVVEVGVYQGVTSARMAAAMAVEARLWLVDPFLPATRPEHLLGFALNERIARRSVRRWRDRVHFLRLSSLAAAARWEAEAGLVDLVFLDADHSYGAVLDDFMAWSALLAPDGLVAFHDSRRCPARPELDAATGPVRLVDEILDGQHGAWTFGAEADSIAVFRRSEVMADARSRGTIVGR
jgi:predicted O-methyltransferase YrrM